MTDPHSYADDAQPSTRHFELELTVDFEAQVLSGTITLHLDRAADGALDLDTRGLAIRSITGPDGASLPFELGAEEVIRGARLRVRTSADRVTVRYQTSPGAVALQWLTPAQTKGGRHPYVFTQCQSIHARTIMPCQDSPRVRSTYTARLDVPRALRAVMAAAPAGRSEVSGERAIERFEMPQAIPSYLFAFAVGDIASRDLGPRSRVYAEPETLDAAAWELAGVDGMITASERLFGPYVWDRFDLLVMPPSFPYGGMENPRLTFLTPTLLAGDRSLVNVVAHELAHSWTGNLVTNASVDHFWLNEGFTVYAERRILEVLEGEEATALHAALGRKHLEVDLARLTASDPKLTRLENELSGVHPDDVYSLVPYEKGYLFLRRVEELAGRDRFDQLLRRYIETFAFRSITTADFVGFLGAQLPDVVARLDLVEWLHGTGLPESAPRPKSARLQRLEELVAAWSAGKRPDAATLATFDANDWQVLLSSLPKDLPRADVVFLEDAVRARLGNAEIRVGFLSIAARAGYEPAYPAIRDTLRSWGRMKYLRPLYGALLAHEAGRALAREVFEAAKDGYHPVARGMVEQLLAR